MQAAEGPSKLTWTFPIANLSRFLKVPPLLLSVVDCAPLSVAATGRRTGSRIIPEKTNIAKTASTNVYNVSGYCMTNGIMFWIVTC